MGIYKGLRNIVFKITGILSQISPVLCSRVVYFCAKGRWLNLKHPKTLNEKFMWLKLNIYNEHPLVKRCADKYAMRGYVEEMGCQELLNPLYGVWTDADEIDFEKLPEKFVLKCNHGSGYNIVCKDKKDFDPESARKQLHAWMKEDYWKRSAELNYRGIQKRITCEKFIDGIGTELPGDYKVMCYYGEPQFILYCDGRGEKTRYLNYDTEWNLLPINRSKDSEGVLRPESLDQMLEYARKLSAAFPAVRMDFYDDHGKPILGEMTFTPAGCIRIAMTKEGLDIYGEKLDLQRDITKQMIIEASKAGQERRSNGRGKEKN